MQDQPTREFLVVVVVFVCVCARVDGGWVYVSFFPNLLYLAKAANMLVPVAQCQTTKLHMY